MPAASSKVPIASSGSGLGQSATFIDALITIAKACGHTDIAVQLNDGALANRSRLLRLPPRDPHHSLVDLLGVANGNTSNAVIYPVFDADIVRTDANGVARGTSLAVDVLFWPGNWSGGAFPSLGAPSILGGGSVTHSRMTVGFGTGSDSWVIRFMGSEYGLYWIASEGASPEDQHCNARPTDTTRPGRNIELIAVTTGGPTFTLGAASGPGAPDHLIFESDGREIHVVLPTGVPLTTFEVAREITMQAAGFIAGQRRAILPNNELLVAAIPKLRFPTAGTTPTGIEPRIRLKYQDPAFVAAGWNFGRYTQIKMDAATAGARGTLQRAASSWPLNAVRIGSYVYNRTKNEWAVVKAFYTTTNPLDTMILDTVPAGWPGDVATDEYDVYPFCDHPLGTGIDGGQYQATKWSNPFATIVKTAPATTTQVVLTDLYGEAQGHYIANQGVLVTNNGLAVILAVDDVTGFVLGEFVENVHTGAYGIIRAIDVGGNRLVVDTIQGRTLAPRPDPLGGYARYFAWNPYQGPPDTYDTIQSMANPESPAKIGTGNTVINSVGGSDAAATEGWSGQLQIVAVSQARFEGGASDDLRTILTLDTGDVGLNANFKVFPSAVVGVRARVRRMLDQNSRYNYVGPYYGDSSTGGYQEDLRSTERLILSSAEPPHAPDADTSSYDLSSYHTRVDGTVLGHGQLGAHAHFRGVNILSAISPAISYGDLLPEQRDAQRIWVACEDPANAGFAADTITPAIPQRICIGPSDSSLG